MYDLLGREVALLVDGEQPAGTYRIRFDANNLASGVYVYRLELKNTVLSGTMAASDVVSAAAG